ncbi:TPA: hypothetical protein GFX96_26050, partial [Escherichia coli]|nr:hypothetical protein [Escherichia coli]
KPYNRTKFLWDGMRLAQESRPEGTGSLYIYRDQGSYEPLARVDKGKRLVRTVLIFTESSDQLSRATDRVPGLPASPGYVQ